MDVKVKTLADKAMLARLTRRKLRTARRDIELEQQVRDAVSDQDLTITKYLFKSPAHPVRQLIRNYDAIYAEHTRWTSPWIDRGPRILAAPRFEQYMAAMREVVGAVERALPGVVDNWGKMIEMDLASRGSRGKVEDYPDASDVAGMFGVDYVVYPIPDVRDFRVDVNPEIEAKLTAAIAEAEQAVKRDAIERMLKPIEAAAKKLAVPIGVEGSIFRESLIENLKDGVEQARLITLEDPEVEQVIDAVEKILSGVVTVDAEALRKVPEARSAAATTLDQLVGNLSGLY